MLLAPHVHWIPGVQANVYLLVEEHGCTLIDTGRENIDQVDLILNYLDRLRFYPAGLRRILLTRAHPDQAGNVAALLDLCEARVSATAVVCRQLGTEREPAPSWGWLGGQSTAVAPLSPTQQTQLDIIQEGDVLPILGGLQVIQVGDKDSGQLAFYLPRWGVLLAGAALWPTTDSAESETTRRLMRFSAAVVATAYGQPQIPHTLDTILAYNV